MTHIENETKDGIEVSTMSNLFFFLNFEILLLKKYTNSYSFQLLNILSEGGIAPEDLVLKLIIARLNSPDIEHYGKFCNIVLVKNTNMLHDIAHALQSTLCTNNY